MSGRWGGDIECEWNSIPENHVSFGKEKILCCLLIAFNKLLRTCISIFSGNNQACDKQHVFLISPSLSQIHPTWRRPMFVSSWVITSWPPAVTCPLAQPLAARHWPTVDQTASSRVSSASSAPDTCRAFAGTTGTAMAARSSSSAKTVPSSPAISKEGNKENRTDSTDADN